MSSGRCIRPRPILTSQCPHATTEVCRPWLIHPAIGWCHLVDMHMPRLIRAGLCFNCVLVANCATHSTQALHDVVYRWLMQILPRWCTHTTTDTSRPWVMLHSIGECCLLDANMPCQMFGNLCQCYLSLVGIVCPKRISLGWWCMPLLDINVTESIHTFHG